MIEGIDLKNFLEKDFIFIKNLNEGFDKYINICFSGEHYNIENFILNSIFESKGCYFDFYFSNLDKINKENFLKLINYDKIINKFKVEKVKIYYKYKF